MPYIKGVDRGQMSLYPECLDDYVSENNLVRVIDIYVEQLDMKKLGFEKAICAQVGRPPYNPKDLLKLYIYGYLNRVRSSRRFEDEASRTIEVM